MLLSWSDYYSGSATEYSQKTTRITFSGNAYIKNSLFNGLYSSSSGGSIYCSSSSSNLLIESCTFINSQTRNIGGAIYFSSGQFVMVKVCGYGCKSTSSSCHFDAVYATDNIIYKNEIHDSSICCSTQSSYNHNVYHCHRKIIVKQINISNNWCNRYSAINLYPSSNGNSVASSISYSSIANNIVSSGYCINLRTSNLHEIDSCNIISNTDQSSNNALILVSGSLNLRGSCILNNSYTFLISNSGGYSITFTNCTIDPTSICSGNTIIVSTPEKSFINKIKFIETAHCYANYDSVGSLTVFPNTTNTYPFGIPPDKVEIIIALYCNKHTNSDLLRVFNCLIIHSFISL